MPPAFVDLTVSDDEAPTPPQRYGQGVAKLAPPKTGQVTFRNSSGGHRRAFAVRQAVLNDDDSDSSVELLDKWGLTQPQSIDTTLRPYRVPAKAVSPETPSVQYTCERPIGTSIFGESIRSTTYTRSHEAKTSLPVSGDVRQSAVQGAALRSSPDLDIIPARPKGASSLNEKHTSYSPKRSVANKPYKCEPYQSAPDQSAPYQNVSHQSISHQIVTYHSGPYQGLPHQSVPVQNVPYQNEHPPAKRQRLDFVELDSGVRLTSNISPLPHALQSVKVDDEYMPDHTMSYESPAPHIVRPESTPQTSDASTKGVKNQAGTWSLWTPEEDDLLFNLKAQGVKWEQITPYFNGRTSAAIQVRYSTKFARAMKKKPRVHQPQIHRPPVNQPPVHQSQIQQYPLPQSVSNAIPAANPQLTVYRQLSVRPGAEDTDTTADEGTFVPRKRIRISRLDSSDQHDAESQNEVPERHSVTNRAPSRATRRKNGFAHLLRHREMGLTSAIHGSPAQELSELQNYALSTIGPARYMDNASGDVSTIAWSPNGEYFAAGAVALTDTNSMQYNKPRNLLLGNGSGSLIRELADHYIPRPKPDVGVNSLHSMHESQDPRLFTTVQMVAFGPSGSSRMYSVSMDGMLNVYDTSPGLSDSSLMYKIDHGDPIDLLSVGNHGKVATGGRSSGSSCVKVFDCYSDSVGEMLELGSGKPEHDAIYPSALKWGVAPNQSDYLLAGFAQTKQRLYEEDDDVDVLGEACLFDGHTGQRIPLKLSRNVFDVCWNPNLGHTAFAIASVGTGKLNPGMHSMIRLFSERSAAMKCSIELECEARDINDVIYSPYDENMIAAGSTDGKVYIWDTRYVDVVQTPHRKYNHGGCLSILAHDRKRWETDTGVRFLQWGNTGNRLYTGSSDGVVKCWDPYLSNEDCHVRDIATFSSAIMSGAFSPDYTRLLIGEDQGRLNLLEIGCAETKVSEMSPLSVIAAEELVEENTRSAHNELLESGQIVYEHAGPLPIRQAVQHPDLPYNIAFGMHGQSTQGYDFTELTRLRSKAAEFQKQLHKSRKTWKRLKKTMPHKVRPCTLGCSFTPRQYGDEGEVPDTQRSIDRIPDEMRRPPPKGMNKFKRGLAATCNACGCPAHPNESGADGANTLCERCSFACFRCGRDAQVEADEVRCSHCRCTWRRDVLGYEVVDESRIEPAYDE